jgi:hypothetical protein
MCRKFRYQVVHGISRLLLIAVVIPEEIQMQQVSLTRRQALTYLASDIKSLRIIREIYLHGGFSMMQCHGIFIGIFWIITNAWLANGVQALFVGIVLDFLLFSVFLLKGFMNPYFVPDPVRDEEGILINPASGLRMQQNSLTECDVAGNRYGCNIATQVVLTTAWRFGISHSQNSNPATGLPLLIDKAGNDIPVDIAGSPIGQRKFAPSFNVNNLALWIPVLVASAASVSEDDGWRNSGNAWNNPDAGYNFANQGSHYESGFSPIERSPTPSFSVNPATGLPMISGDTFGVDAGGNPYGTSIVYDPYSDHSGGCDVSYNFCCDSSSPTFDYSTPSYDHSAPSCNSGSTHSMWDN